MNDRTDSELLCDYAENRSEAAFNELVHRYVDMTYSAALRMVCDAHLAEDVTQSAFLALSRNAGQLVDRSVLSGWLHRTAQNIAAQTVRTIERRRAREKEAATMNELLADQPEDAWDLIAPHLDAALAQLDEPNREALFLRYFERKSAREIAGVLGTSEEAAQKRVSRAVERLREFFAKRGITVGTGGLAAALAANAVQSAPAGLALAISSAASLGAASVAVTATKAIAMTTLQKTIITSIAACVVATLVIQHRSSRHLREENLSLQQQITRLRADNESLSKLKAQSHDSLTLSLPAPRVPVSTQPADTATGRNSTELISRMQRGEKAPALTAEQAEAYLNQNNRNAASLLAAFRATGDRKLLEEAAQRFPDDPQVAFTAAYAPGASSEDQRRWLDAFKQSAPDNALANFLSAANHFKAGRTDQAIQDLNAAAAKRTFQDYTWDFVQNGQEAYRAAGYPEAEARTIPTMSLLLPQFAELKQLNGNILDLAAAYKQSGDEPSAQAALQIDLAMGQRLEEPENASVLSKLVGMALEFHALKQMDPASPYGDTGQTVGQRLDELNQRRTALTAFGNQLDTIYTTISASDWISYHDRWQAFGEENAVKWLLSKYPGASVNSK